MITLGANDASYGFGRFRNRIELFDIIPGTRQFTIPDGWKKIRVAVVGPGGGGQKSISSTYKYGGGGGGGGSAAAPPPAAPPAGYNYDEEPF